MKFLTPILLVIVAGAVFFLYIDPQYANVKKLKAEAAQYDQALNNSKQLQTVRDELLSKYNTFSTSDITKLQKMLPDNVDNVRLILDIDGIASKYGMTIRNVLIDQTKPATDLGPDESKYQSIALRFSVNSTYDNFRNFLADLEQSLRIVDVVGVSFNASDTDFSEYGISLKTYWLK